MRVSVRYFGHLRDELGEEESYDLFSDSKLYLLSEILEELSKRKGEAFKKNIYSNSFNPRITVLLNGNVVLNDQVKVDGDCFIVFVPFIDGG
jgi:molybdopterin converting factor small subunit